MRRVTPRELTGRLVVNGITALVLLNLLLVAIVAAGFSPGVGGLRNSSQTIGDVGTNHDDAETDLPRPNGYELLDELLGPDKTTAEASNSIYAATQPETRIPGADTRGFELNSDNVLVGKLGLLRSSFSAVGQSISPWSK